MKAQIPWQYLLTPDTVFTAKVRPNLNIDNRVLRVNNQDARQVGLNAGIKFGKRDSRVTIGYYWINFYDRFITLSDLPNNPININFYKPTSSQYINFRYVQGIIKNSRFVLKVPLQVGYGSYDSFEEHFWNDKRMLQNKVNFTPLQIGLYSELKFVRYFDLYGRVGSYNFINQGNKLNSGIYYRFNVKINTNFIVKDIINLIKYKSIIKPVNSK